MKNFLYLVLVCGFLAGCDSSKKNATPATLPTPVLSGTWRLFYITGPRISFEGLYPGKKPTMSFDSSSFKLSGNTGCNRYFGQYEQKDKQLLIKEPLGMTKMMCATGAEGETIFVNMLKKVSQFTLNSDTLILSDVNNIELMKLLMGNDTGNSN